MADNPRILVSAGSRIRRKEIVTNPGDAWEEITITEGSPSRTISIVRVFKIDGEEIRFPVGTFNEE